MLKLQFTIYDIKSGLYTNPVCANSDAEAKRTFADICVDAEHPVGQHPEDYSLHRLGTFNDVTAEIIQHPPEVLATGLEMVSAAQNVNKHQLNLLDKEINEAKN